MCYIIPGVKCNGDVYSHDALFKGMKFGVCHRETSQQGVAEQRTLWLSCGDDMWLAVVQFGLSLLVFEP